MTKEMILTILIQTVGFGIGLFKIYTDMQVKLKELDVRLQTVEKQDDEIYSKLDKIIDKLAALELKIVKQNFE
jgi:hypothetical protein